VEQLESRALLAFDLTLSSSPTIGVSVTDSTTSAFTTRHFTADSAGANVSFADIQAAFSALMNVVIDSGSAGAEAGNITSAATASFTNSTGANLQLQSGTGAGLVGDISIAGLSLSGSASTLVLHAAHNVSLSGEINTSATGTVSIVATSGAIS